MNVQQHSKHRASRGARPPRRRAFALGVAGALCAVILPSLVGWTEASFVDNEMARTTLTADTLEPISPTVAPSATSAEISWATYSGMNLTTQYSLSRALDASGTGATSVYNGPNATATDTGRFNTAAQVNATASRIAAGANHTCAIESGTVYCWGANGSAQVTGASTTPATVTTPTTVSLPGTASAISAGTTHTCAIVSGKVYCWGSNGSGELGGSSTSTPVGGALASKTVTSVSAGNAFTCAIADGAAYCWGNNTSGKLGIGSTTPTTTATPQAVRLPTGTVTSISASSGDHACAVISGVVYCWGENGSGQLGDGTYVDRYAPVALNLTAGTKDMAGKNAYAVTLGTATSCANSDGGVFCWGEGSNGELGNSASVDSTYPKLVTGSASWKAASVSTSGYHSCALTSTYALKCWGQNGSGELGNNSTTNANSPVDVLTSGALAGTTPSMVSAGGQFTCTLAGSSVYCWGSNASSQLGDGTTTQHTTPVAAATPTVTGCANGASLLAGDLCSLAPRTTYWWQLGYTYGPWTAPQSAPVSATTTNRPTIAPSATSVTSRAVNLAWNAYSPDGLQTGRYVLERATDSSGSNTTTISNNALLTATDPGNLAATVGVAPSSTAAAGYFRGCYLAQNQVWCWGYDPADGRLGNGSASTSNVPVRVLGLEGKTLTSLSTWGTHVSTGTSCVLADGKPYCWGNNDYGQIGNGTGTDALWATAVDTSGVLSGKSITQISAGAGHVCAIADGAAYCWGWNNDGQLGDGTVTSSSVPVAVTGAITGKTVTDISAGEYATCAVADGAAYCWGLNAYGRLGDNTVTERHTAVAVDPSSTSAMAGKTVTSISTAYYDTCAVADGAAYCWGDDAFGALGDNGVTVGDAHLPVAVYTGGALNATTVTSISTGEWTNCVIADSRAYCWGNGANGRLGNGGVANSQVPVAVAGALAGTSVTSLGTAYANTCASTSAGAAYCWGSNAYGALGNGGVGGDSSVPVAVSMPSSAYCPGGGVSVPNGCSLLANTTYYYRVRFFIGAWAGPASDWVPVTTATDPWASS